LALPFRPSKAQVSAGVAIDILSVPDAYSTTFLANWLRCKEEVVLYIYP
jgi:hypothetical protein